MSLELYSEQELAHTLDTLFERLTRHKAINDSPRAVLLGGQSGAGKTGLHRIKRKEFGKNIIIIDGDSYRGEHPRYDQLQDLHGKDCVNYTKAFAGACVEGIINKLSQAHYNLIIEGTLRTSDVPMKTAQQLLSKGYQVEFALMVTKPELSYLSTLIRYEEMYSLNPDMARATPKDHHDGIVANLCQNMQALADSGLFYKISLYNRQMEEIQVEQANAISQILEEHLLGTWSPFEKENYRDSLKRFENLCILNGHMDTYVWYRENYGYSIQIEG